MKLLALPHKHRFNTRKASPVRNHFSKQQGEKERARTWVSPNKLIYPKSGPVASVGSPQGFLEILVLSPAPWLMAHPDHSNNEEDRRSGKTRRIPDQETQETSTAIQIEDRTSCQQLEMGTMNEIGSCPRYGATSQLPCSQPRNPLNPRVNSDITSWTWSAEKLCSLKRRPVNFQGRVRYVSNPRLRSNLHCHDRRPLTQYLLNRRPRR